MQIEAEMRYALRLAALIRHHEFEDLFKLASLVDSIANLRRQGPVIDVSLDAQFRATIKAAYASNGAFRQEVAARAEAKRFIAGL